MKRDVKKKVKLLNQKYAGKVELSLTESSKMIHVKLLEPMDHPTGQVYLNYTIDLEDHREVGFNDRTRNLWLRNEDGRGIQSVSYCGGMGVWQVSQGGEPMAFGDLPESSQKMVEEWLEAMDKRVFDAVPELKPLIK
jgi:hypothetical protein